MMKKYVLRLMTLSLAIVLLTGSASALTLRYPQRGENVTTLQTALKMLGYYDQNIDGIYGNGTRAAVKEFQAAWNLTRDGVAGPKTLEKIEALTGIVVGGPSDAGDSDDDDQSSSGSSSSDGNVSDGNGTGLFGGVYTTLKIGSSGERVRILQRALKALGYDVGHVDGDFGSATYVGVKAFQKSNSLTVDGKAGKNTLMKLETFFDADGNLIGTPSVPPAQEEESKPEYTVPTRTLRYGMSGDDVKYTQERLKALGYYTGTLDGKFGTGLLTAVMAFQRRNGLTADGAVGSRTSAALFSDDAIAADGTTLAPPVTPPVITPDDPPEDEILPVPPVEAPDEEITIPTRTLRYGDSGEDVKLLQQRLIELNYLTGTADGDFGSKTRTAVRAFQANNGLSVDGVAGTKTYAILFSDKAVAAAPESGEPEDEPTTDLIPVRSLTIGDSGDDVKSVQLRLKALEYLLSSADGQYGSSTAAAMKAFQQMNGLTATGNGDLATYAALYSDSALNAKGVTEGAANPSYTNLRSGATGPAVIRLQQALVRFDYKLSVTGTYDEATEQAVRSFQSLNGLSVDGVAGRNTQSKLYSSSVVRFPVGPDQAIYGSMGYVAEPAKSQIKLLHWADQIKGSVSNGQAILAYDPVTDISWSLTIIARGRHCDVEPTTKADTAAMHAAFGYKEDWTPKPVYVRLPSGTWTVATTHNVAHGINPIPNNDFEGQNCVHFLRDMSETEQKDPDYGVTNQKALRKFWLELTGQEIPYK